MAELKNTNDGNAVVEKARSKYSISLDTWAVALALLAAALVRLNVITRVKW